MDCFDGSLWFIDDGSRAERVTCAALRCGLWVVDPPNGFVRDPYKGRRVRATIAPLCCVHECAGYARCHIQFN